MESVAFYNVKEAPFDLYGYAPECYPAEFARIPKEIAEQANPGVVANRIFTAGIRARFATNAKTLAIRVKSGDIRVLYHMPALTSAGFDLYRIREDGSGVFRTAFKLGATVMAAKTADWYESSVATGSGGEMRQYQLDFPLYSPVKELEIGAEPGAVFAPGLPYRKGLPFVAYGSSITQGACASRPGLYHLAIVSRRLNLDYRNLGYSGSCKGEPAVAAYFASVPASAYLLEYDHNSTPDELIANHERVARTVREKNPDAPIVIASRPDYNGSEDNKKRRERVLNTVLTLQKEGDKNVYFLDGAALFGTFEREECTQEGTHPNDLGFYRYAEALTPLMRKIYGLDEHAPLLP